MGTPVLIKREETVLEGVKSYFFPSLLLHVIANEENFLENGKINPFASFVLGLTEEKPTNAQIYEMIASSDEDRMNTAIDTLFVLGKEYIPQIQKIGTDLVASGCSHDVYEVFRASKDWDVFEKNLASFVRKMFIRKCDPKYLSYIWKIGSAKDDTDKFNEITELCRENLEWDAYVLIKLLGLETEERKEEIDAIRDNILVQLKNTRPKLTELIFAGPKHDVVYLLNNKFSSSLDEIDEILIAKLTPLLSKKDEISLENRQKFISQLYYVILRSLMTENLDFVINYVSTIPKDIHSLLFEGLNLIVFESTIRLTMYFIKAFIPSSGIQTELSYGDVISSRLYTHLQSHWRRDAIERTLKSFLTSITEDVFGSSMKLFDGDDSITKVGEVLKFLLWIVRSFEDEEQDYCHLNGFTIEFKSTAIQTFRSLQRFSEISNEHVYRVITALEKSNNDVSILTRGVSPATINMENGASEDESGVDTRETDECDSPIDPNEQTIIAMPKEKNEKFVSSSLKEEQVFQNDVSQNVTLKKTELSMSVASLDGWEGFEKTPNTKDSSSNMMEAPSRMSDVDMTSRPNSRVVNDTFLLESERPKPLASFNPPGFNQATTCSSFGNHENAEAHQGARQNEFGNGRNRSHSNGSFGSASGNGSFGSGSNRNQAGNGFGSSAKYSNHNQSGYKGVPKY